MPLPNDLQFSQSSLQDYVDCPRRFQLRYILRHQWPAIAAAPVLEFERLMRLGATFHQLVQQHELGIPADRLAAMIHDDDLHDWWGNYRQQAPTGLPDNRYPEHVLSAPLAGWRLVAKYDLLAIAPGERAIIIDWKTGQRRPTRQQLAARLQTRVYRYLLVAAGAHLNGGKPLTPEQVEMRYWFANHPDQPEVFTYDAGQFEADGEYLRDLIAEIATMGPGEDDFPLTEEEGRCRYCVYRSLCGRGVAAGPLEGDEAGVFVGDFDFDLDLGDVDEVVF